MKAPYFFLLLCAGAASGCTASLSRLAPYSRYMGHEVTLQRPAVLHEMVVDKRGEWLPVLSKEDGSMSDLVISQHRLDQ